MVILVNNLLLFLLLLTNHVCINEFANKYFKQRSAPLALDTISPNPFLKIQFENEQNKIIIHKRVKGLLTDTLLKKIKWNECQLNNFSDRNRNAYKLMVYNTDYLNEFLIYSDLKGYETLKFIELNSINGNFLDSVNKIIAKNEKREYEKSRTLSLSQVNNSSIGNEDQFVVFAYVSHKVEMVPFYNVGWIFGEGYSGTNTFITFHVKLTSKNNQ